MKNFLMLAFCFFAMQMNSCGSIEVEAEATKLTIINDSKKQLNNVRCCRGVDFGNIKRDEFSTKEISELENIKINFEIDGKDSTLYTQGFKGKEYRLIKCIFDDTNSFTCNGESLGLEEPENEDTQYTIFNDSEVPLLDVSWHGVAFGDIGVGNSSTKEITTYGYAYITFKNKNGVEYNTYDFFKSKELSHSTYRLNNGTSIIRNETILTLGELK